MATITTNRTSQAQVSVITDDAMLAKLEAITDHITTFLCRKAMVEYRRQDLSNRTMLDKVNFWFQIDPRSGSTILCYDKHPTEWDVNAIIQAITDLEHIFYVQEGNIIHWKGL